MQQSGLPRKGFSVPVQVTIDRSNKHAPIIVPTDSGDGGVQVHLVISFMIFVSFHFRFWTTAFLFYVIEWLGFMLEEFPKLLKLKI